MGLKKNQYISIVKFLKLNHINFTQSTTSDPIDVLPTGGHSSFSLLATNDPIDELPTLSHSISSPLLTNDPKDKLHTRTIIALRH